MNYLYWHLSLLLLSSNFFLTAQAQLPPDVPEPSSVKAAAAALDAAPLVDSDPNNSNAERAQKTMTQSPTSAPTVLAPPPLPVINALPTWAPIVERVMPAIVNIATNSGRVTQKDLLGLSLNYNSPKVNRRVVNLGSGVVINAQLGYVVTNHHVVDNADEIWVTLEDGRRFQATILGSDNDVDLALIQIKADNLQEMSLADSEQVRVGDFVLAVGNPFGLERSVTSGIISAKGRSNLGIKGFENFIQTDASINPGNSGGALVNLSGQLIGINTAIVSPSGAGNVGVGFAIPSNMIKPIIDQLIQFGRVEHGELGIKIRNLTDELVQTLRVPVTRGVVVVNLNNDSPALLAGLQKNDVIVKVNNLNVYTMEQLRNQVALSRPGTPLTLEFYRGNKLVKASATIGKAQLRLWPIEKSYPALAGSYFSPTNNENSSSSNASGGVATSKVDQLSRAWLAGIRPGDIIAAVNEEKVKDLDHFIQLVNKYAPHDMVFHIYRGRSSFYLIMQRM